MKGLSFSPKICDIMRRSISSGRLMIFVGRGGSFRGSNGTRFEFVSDADIAEAIVEEIALMRADVTAFGLSRT